MMAAKNRNEESYLKKVVASVFNQFIYGGHLLAVGLACVVVLAAVLMRLEVTFDLVLVIYFFTLGAALFGRYIDIKKDLLTNPERSKYLNKQIRTTPFIITFCVVLALMILVLNNKFEIIFFCLVMLLFSLFYDLFLKKLTKKILGFKNIYIGILFSLLILIPMLYYNFKLGVPFALVVIFVFIMTFTGTAFSDVKDIEADTRDNLKTYAVVLGHKKLIILLSVIRLFALVPICIGVYLGMFPVYAFMLAFIVPWSIFLFWESFKSDIKVDLLYGFLFDSEFIVWLLLVLVGKELMP